MHMYLTKMPDNHANWTRLAVEMQQQSNIAGTHAEMHSRAVMRSAVVMQIVVHERSQNAMQEG